MTLGRLYPRGAGDIGETSAVTATLKKRCMAGKKMKSVTQHAFIQCLPQEASSCDVREVRDSRAVGGSRGEQGRGCGGPGPSCRPSRGTTAAPVLPETPALMRPFLTGLGQPGPTSERLCANPKVLGLC